MTVPNTNFNHLLGQHVNVFVKGSLRASGELFFVGTNAVGHKVVSLKGGGHMTVKSWNCLTIALHVPEPGIGVVGDRSWLNTLT